MAKQVKKTITKTVKSIKKPVKKVVKSANTITVKNAEGEPDTTATILIQNKIQYTPKVSVVIPVYNVEQYLRECLDSVCNQTLQEIEIICVDDGSTDSSLEILKEYAARDNRITIITQKNLHAGVARNAGLAVARGEYLSFLDSDDFFELNMLEETYKNAIKNKSDIVMFNLYLYDDTTKENKAAEWTLDIKDVPSIFNYKDIPDRIFKLSNCWVWNRLYKHKFIQDAALHFQNLGCANDTYFSCIATVLAKKITHLDTRFVHYRTNRQQFQNVTSVSFRHKHPTDLLNCFYTIYNKLKKLKVYDAVKYSYLVVATEHICWSEQAFLTDEKLYKQFTKYLVDNYKNIFKDARPFTNNTLNKKYIKLRNILIDGGVFKEIPKRIFYVWGANEPIRPEVQKCIDTWKKFLPDYDIVQIDDDSTHYFNFQQELKQNKWFRTVFKRKMWAYVADYIRIKALYNNGGIYFDTDVSVVQNMDKFLHDPAFVGMQRSSVDGTGDWVEPAICGAQKHNKFFKKIASFYDELIWKEPIYTMPHLFNYYLRKYDIFPFPKKSEQKIIKLPDITIYPERYFIPYRWNTEFKPECIEPDTHTIHHWGGSWTKPETIRFLQNKHLLFNSGSGPKVSVIIPVYDVEKYLPQCLDSVMNQTLQDIEIICVNDGSPDNSLKILKEYAKKDDRIKIINQKNQGLSCSRNNALKVAHGEYIMFLDSDDWIRNDACELLYIDSKSGNLDMLNFAGTNYNQDTKETKSLEVQTMKYVGSNDRVFDREQMQQFMYRIPISACRFFYRRKFLQENHMWFPKGINFEDNYFVRRALIFVQKYGVERETLYFRRVHNGAITQNVAKFFADYIEVVNRIDDMYSEYNMEDIAKPIIRDYLNMLYARYLSMPYLVRAKFRNSLFQLFVKAQRKYHFDDTKYNLMQFMKQELSCWFSQFRKDFDFDNPKTFNEKIQWLKLHESTPIKTRLADKYLVRDWVAEKIGDEYLIPILGVYDSFDEIDFKKLPKQFVIKTNHGSATNIIVTDKSKLNIDEARKKVSEWLAFNYAFNSFELHYLDIKPKIIIEKYMDDGTGDLQDYKIMCFNGKPEFIWVDSDRHTEHKRNFFDLKWREMDVKMQPAYGKKKNLPAPKTLKEMIRIAKKLSVGFCVVRVDLYEIQGHVYFGEMTFTSSSGAEQIVPESFGLHLGKLIKLPKRAYDICTDAYYDLPKARKKNNVKPYLLFPYYGLASLWMKIVRIPLLKFRKHVRAVLYARSYRGKMAMLNANFNNLQRQIDTLSKYLISGLEDRLNNLSENFNASVDAKYSDMSDKINTEYRELLENISVQNTDNKRIENSIVTVQNKILALDANAKELSTGIVQKLDTNKKELATNIEKERILYFNPWSTTVNTERGNCDIVSAPDFENRFKKLVSGLSPNDAATIIKIISRLKLIKGTNCKLDLFTIDEKALLQRTRDFYREILKVSDNLYAYKNYLLPVNHFEPSVFLYNHGIERLDSVDVFKNKDILDVGGFIGDSVLMLSPLTHKKIYSFEASKENYDLMLKTIKLNNIKNAVPVHAAVGDKNGEIELLFSGSASSQNDIMVKNPEYVEKSPLIKIDDYVREHNINVGLIKVDIEGAEQAFLRGARKTIEKYKPTLLISIYHNVDDFLDIKPMIESWNLGYKFKIFKPVIESVSGETLLICEQ